LSPAPSGGEPESIGQVKKTTMKELTAAQVKTHEILHGVTESIDRITRTLEPLAASVAAHDSQIEALIRVVEKHDAQITKTSEAVAALERQRQAYINTLAHD
jgi:ABC-type transporter Mla subunit MlaD